MSGIRGAPRRGFRHLSIGILLSGVLGGLLVVGVAAMVGWWRPSRRTVTVVYTHIVSATAVARRSGVPTARQIYELDSPGVVFVNAVGINRPQSSSEYFKGEGGQQVTATGSGFEADGAGTILTDWHVVDGALKITIGLEGGHTVGAKVVGKDPSHDIALLRIPTVGLTLHPLVLGDSSIVGVGDEVLAIGDPFGLAGTLTTGVVSALERKIEAPNGHTIDNAFQTDAPINPG